MSTLRTTAGNLVTVGLTSRLKSKGLHPIFVQRTEGKYYVGVRHTSLTWACENGHEKVVIRCLEKGADVNAKTIDG